VHFVRCCSVMSRETRC